VRHRHSHTSTGLSRAGRIGRAAAVAGGIVIGLGTLAGVGASSAATHHSSAKATLTVWVDSTREPAIKDYEKTHPNVKINLVIYDGDANGDGSLFTKVALFNRVGSGWPDVSFSEGYNDIASLTDSSLHYPARLDNGLVPQSTLNNFAKGTLSVCDVDGHLYCLRNDLAQDVTWYNATLMKQFGYSVPTTWQQYQALGEEVAKQHPGYIIGEAGDSFDDTVYLQANRCPVDTLKNSSTVEIDPGSPYCSRIVQLLDPRSRTARSPPTASSRPPSTRPTPAKC